ncbi:MAG: hypothetical protein WC406_11480 [Methanoregula sp.]|nr:hypothetical protein [Methanoregula sp.]MDD5024980.1 hypothetical protein [Methanoregula sp.]
MGCYAGKVARIDRNLLLRDSYQCITRARMNLKSWQTGKVGIGWGRSLAFHQSRQGQWVFVLPYMVVLRVARHLAAREDDLS